MVRRVLGRVRTATAVWVSAAMVVVGSIVFVALRSDGAVATNVQLDDGVVWVTNQELSMVGRLNVEIDEIDTAVLGAPLGIDVVQQGRRVVFAGELGGVQRLNVANGGAVGNNQVPIVDYQMAGGVAVVYDETTGALWVGSDENIAGSTYPDSPDALVEPGSKVIVTAATRQTSVPGVNDQGELVDRGKVMVLGTDGWHELLLDNSFAPVRADADPDYVPETSLLPPTTLADQPPPTVPPAEVYQLPPTGSGVSLSDVAELSAVGGRPVVLTNDMTLVLNDDEAVALEGDHGRLQQVGDDANAVFVATDRALFRVGLDGEPAATIVASRDGGEPIGRPSQPVRVGRCTYAAWSAIEPTYVRWCDGDELALPQPIAGAQPNVELVWRVNQRTVALNAPGNGDAWADHDGVLAYVGNWADVEPEPNTDKVSESVGESDLSIDRRCQEGYRTAPIAGDDTVGVRPRQSTIEVLNNDDDFDCEPFRIESISPADGEFGALTIIDAGQRLLWSPDDTFIETGEPRFSFTYVLTDAAGHRSEPATVSVTVMSDDQNSPPMLLGSGSGQPREMKSVVEEGHSTSYDVLADWTDVDGDHLEVTNAAVEGNGTVSVSREGAVTFEANGVPPGVSTVAVTVSDGRAETTAEWSVTVAPRGTELPPTAQDDFVVVAVGSTVTVDPLTNDSDPNEDELAMQPLWGDSQPIRTRSVGGQVSITPESPGVFRLDYAANDGTGAQPAAAAILVTAVDAGSTNRAPVAVPDSAQIRSGRVLNIDVLENDVDADGDPLAIADVSAENGIRVTVVDRHLLQVEVPDDGITQESSAQRFAVTYRVVDGHESERLGAIGAGEDPADANLRSFGTLRVETIPATEDLPPVLQQDQLIVRAGEVAAARVLDNDIDPDTDELMVTALDPQRVEALESAGQVVVWNDDTRVYAYGVEPGRYSIAYSATANGVSVSSEVMITVTAPGDAETNPNRPPEPPRRLVRAVRGGTVRVQLPLDNSDPDGDPVALVAGLGASEVGGGNAVAVDPEDPTVLLFTADLNSPRQDRFTYTVADRLGAQATGTVDVVVVDDVGLSPQAHDDVYVVKPGRTLVVPALDNDTSPQDRQLSFANPPFFDRDGQPSATPVNPDAVTILDQSNPDREGMMTVLAPTDRSTIVESYRITDGISTSSAFVRVTPNPNAPNRGPLVGDDIVRSEDLGDLGIGDEYAVDVLANDLDADNADDAAALSLTVPTFQQARADGDRLAVTLSERPQTIVYRATDNDGASAVGLVSIPAVGNHPPELSEIGRDADQRVLPVGSEQPLRVELDTVVTDPDGDAVAFTSTPPKLVGGDATLEADEAGFTVTPKVGPKRSEIISVEIEVTDRPLLSDAERQDPSCNCLSTLVVRSIIERSGAPQVVRAGAVDVPQLDEPVTYDISPLVVDEDGDRLTYAMQESSLSGLDVSLDGSLLRIVSPSKRNIGDRITLRYTASDGVNDPVENVVVVTIVGSNRAAPRTGTLGPFDAIQGTPLELPNLVDAAFNPFEDQPLTLSSWDVNGNGVADLSCSGSGSCTFSTDSDTIDRATASYTVTDALGREAQGSFELRVKGRPLAPLAPQVESVGDRQVTLSWVEPDLRGGVFQRYEVRTVETGEVMPYLTTGGTVTELVNQTTYRFEVRAVNDVGEGEWSPPSTGATPDRAPDPPINLAFPAFDNGSLTLSWSPPATTDQYSPITNYQIKLSDGQIFDVDTNTNELVVGAGGSGPALENGREYRFQARSRNSADQNNGWSDWSQPSPPETPARYPDPPTEVVAVHAGTPDEPLVYVAWNPPSFDGGRPLSSYQVCTAGGSEICVVVGAGRNQATFSDLTAGTTYTFNVVALNILDQFSLPNESSPVMSGPVTVVRRPDPPTLTAVEVGDHKITVLYQSANGSGCKDAASTEFAIDGGGWQQSNTFTGLTNGQSYTFAARTVLPSTCGTPGETYASVDSNQLSGVPLGAPPVVTFGEPTIDRSKLGKTTVTWSVKISRGQDGLGKVSVSGSGSPCSTDVGAPAEGSTSTGAVTATFSNEGQTVTCEIAASSSVGRDGYGSASHSAWDPPKKETRKTSASLWNYIPNKTYKFRCWTVGPFHHDHKRTTDSEGDLSTGSLGNCRDVEFLG